VLVHVRQMLRKTLLAVDAVFCAAHGPIQKGVATLERRLTAYKIRLLDGSIRLLEET
jgi:hypothetical protein